MPLIRLALYERQLPAPMVTDINIGFAHPSAPSGPSSGKRRSSAGGGGDAEGRPLNYGGGMSRHGYDRKRRLELPSSTTTCGVPARILLSASARLSTFDDAG